MDATCSVQDTPQSTHLRSSAGAGGVGRAGRWGLDMANLLGHQTAAVVGRWGYGYQWPALLRRWMYISE